MKANFDILVTTVNKTHEQILELVKSNNLHGNIYIGNQKSDVDLFTEIKISEDLIKIFDMTSVGVSKNRNFLLKQAKSDYVLFLDDDVKIITYNFDRNFDSKYNAFRFNLISKNLKRPILQIKKTKKLKYKNVKSFGAWGIFFNKDFLLRNNLLFNEQIGPGCLINHGEDGVFLKKFTEKGTIYQFSQLVFEIAQDESTWQGSNRNIKLELFSHGYTYGLSYEKASPILLLYTLIKNQRLYKSNGSILKNYRIALLGYRYYRKHKVDINEEEIKKLIFGD